MTDLIRPLILKHFPSLRPRQIASMERNLQSYLEGAVDVEVKATEVLLAVRRSLEDGYSKAPAVKIADHFRAVDRVELSARCKEVLKLRKFDRAYYLAALGYVGSEPSTEALEKVLGHLYQERTEPRVMLRLTLGIEDIESVKLFAMALKSRFPEIVSLSTPRKNKSEVPSLVVDPSLSTDSIKSLIVTADADGVYRFPEIEQLRKSDARAYTDILRSSCQTALGHARSMALIPKDKLDFTINLLRVIETYLSSGFVTLSPTEGSRIVARGLFLSELKLDTENPTVQTRSEAFKIFSDTIKKAPRQWKARISIVEDDILKAIFSSDPLNGVLEIEATVRKWLSFGGMNANDINPVLSALKTLRQAIKHSELTA